MVTRQRAESGRFQTKSRSLAELETPPHILISLTDDITQDLTQALFCGEFYE